MSAPAPAAVRRLALELIKARFAGGMRLDKVDDELMGQAFRTARTLLAGWPTLEADYHRQTDPPAPPEQL